MATVTQTSPDGRFTSEEVEHLHDEDIHAARIVVCLMSGVFAMGLLMYAFICWLAM